MHKIKRLTKEQNQWLRDYYHATGFEPMHLDEVEAGKMSFNQAAKANIDWFEAHFWDAFRAISSDVPTDEEA